ncbi:hypothetical protein C8J56DRAFT_492299 [Mycena floridula]|nr:hypothetical protein C8J56DRAFT_492299 [Mycena floridula]
MVTDPGTRRNSAESTTSFNPVSWHSAMDKSKSTRANKKIQSKSSWWIEAMKPRSTSFLLFSNLPPFLPVISFVHTGILDAALPFIVISLSVFATASHPSRSIHRRASCLKDLPTAIKNSGQTGYDFCAVILKYQRTTTTTLYHTNFGPEYHRHPYQYNLNYYNGDRIPTSNAGCSKAI